MLGTTNKAYNTNLVIIEDVSGKEGAKSFFNVKMRNEAGEWPVTQTVNEFSGRFKSLTVGKRYDPNNPKHAENIEKYGNPHKITLELEDLELKETYRYRFNLRMSTRSLINKLLNLTSREPITIQISNDREKHWENLWVKQGGKNIQWKYSREEYPAAKEFTIKGKLVRDYDEQDQFFVDAINNFSLPVDNGVVEVTKDDSSEIPF